MGRRRKHSGDSGLASDQIPGQNQNNTGIRPCHSLPYRRQAFRSNTEATLSHKKANCKHNLKILRTCFDERLGRERGNGVIELDDEL